MLAGRWTIKNQNDLKGCFPENFHTWNNPVWMGNGDFSHESPPFILFAIAKKIINSIQKWQLVSPPSVFQLSLHSTKPIFTLLPFTILCDGENIKNMTFMQGNSLSLWLYVTADF